MYFSTVIERFEGLIEPVVNHWIKNIAELSSLVNCRSLDNQALVASHSQVFGLVDNAFP